MGRPTAADALPYQLRSEIGAGPIGRVFAAEQPPSPMPLALKRFHPGLVADDASRQAIWHAYTALSRVTSAYLHPVLHVELHPDHDYLVMPRDNGDSLATRWAGLDDARRRTDPQMALAYVTQLADGLAVLHGAGLAHGNLKPSNVRVRAPFPAKPPLPTRLVLADAVFAELVAARKLAAQQADGAIYAAPELLDGSVVPRSDQYALAVLAWIWLAGQAPFAPRSLQSIVSQKRDVEHLAVSAAGRIEARALRVLLRALQPEPEARFPGVGEFRDALADAITRGAGGIADDAAVVAAPTVSRRQVLLGGAVAAGTLGVVALTRPWLGRLARALTAQQAAAQDGNPLPLTFQRARVLAEPRGQVNAVAWSPDARRIAAAADENNLYIWGAETGQLAGKPLAGHDGFVMDVRWSPDGRWLASSSVDGTARIWDARTGATRLVLRGHTDQVIGVAWYPDGSRLVTGSADKSLRLWDAATGQTLRTYHPKGIQAPIRVIAIAPDGMTVAAGDRAGTICVFDTRTGTQVAVLSGSAQGVLALAYRPAGAVLASAGLDTRTRLWNLALATPLAAFPPYPIFVRSLAWSRSGEVIATGYEDGAVLFRRASGPPTLMGKIQAVGAARALAWNGPGDAVAIGTNHDTVEIWQPTSY